MIKLPQWEKLYSTFNRLKKRERAIFYVAAVIAAFTFIDRLIIAPVVFKVNSLNRQISEQEAGIKQGLRILSQKDKIASENTKLKSYLVSFKSQEEEVTAALKEIEGLANKNSVYVVDMKPGAVKEAEATKKYYINLECEGQMEQLVKFMYDIESSNQLFSVDKYEITPKYKESSVAKCSMSISKIVIM